MTENEQQPSPKAFFASITVRIIYLTIFTAALIIGGFILLENRELHKVVPLTPQVKFGILLGQAMALVSANYFLANHAKNFTDSISETCIIFAAIFSCVSFLGPHMFREQVGVDSHSWWQFWQDDSPILVPNNLFYFGLIPAGLCFLTVIARLFIFRSHPE
jgi:hypothetical protein